MCFECNDISFIADKITFGFSKKVFGFVPAQQKG